MKYFVVIDGRSAFGQGYADFFPKALVGSETHVLLVCTELELNHPLYMRAKTAPTKKEAPSQRLQVPHGNVLFVVEQDEDQPDEELPKFPMGFLSPQEPDVPRLSTGQASSTE